MRGASARELVSELLDALRELLGDAPHELHRPRLTLDDESVLVECIRSGYVSSVGGFVTRFEDALAKFTNSGAAIAVSSGTAALEVALRLVGVKAGEEVFCPALTFIGTANAISHIGANPHFVDSEEYSLGIDPSALRDELMHIAKGARGKIYNARTGQRIAAIVPVHIFGHSCNLGQLLEISEEFGIPLVEDAAESLGSYYSGLHTGTLGAAGTLSFNGNKVVTTGGGGAILTNDLEIAERARHITSTARVRHTWRFEHDEVGYNYRMPNVNAALGCSQLSALPDFIRGKRRLFERYWEVLHGVRGLRLVAEPAWGSSNYWLISMMLDRGLEDLQSDIVQSCVNRGYGVRPVWTPLHLTKPYARSERGALRNAESLGRRLVSLPSGFDAVEHIFREGL